MPAADVPTADILIAPVPATAGVPHVCSLSKALCFWWRFIGIKWCNGFLSICVYGASSFSYDLYMHGGQLENWIAACHMFIFNMFAVWQWISECIV